MDNSLNTAEQPQINQDTDKFELWKQDIQNTFSQWLNNLSPGEIDDSDKIDDSLDLFSFYSALASLQTESKKLSRKTVESLSGFGEVLNKINTNIEIANSSKPPSYALQIIGFSDRIARIQSQLREAPSPKKFFNDNRWSKFHDTISEAIDLLAANTTDLLKKMGLQRIATVDEQFDPHCMIAVEVVNLTTLPDNQVVEEITAGYLHKENIVRLAEVKVSRNRS